MTTRIATLNIRHGGRRNGDALTNRLLGYGADILVVTEFRANDVGARLIARLANAGYATSHPDVGPKHNSVLIASRCGIDRSWAFDRNGIDPGHLWGARGRRRRLVWSGHAAAHRKAPLLAGVDAGARRDGVDLLVGDCNTGNNELDKDPKRAKFIGPEKPGRLGATGYTDVWRSLHPGAREYSWFSRPGQQRVPPRLRGRGARSRPAGLRVHVRSCAADHLRDRSFGSRRVIGLKREELSSARAPLQPAGAPA